MKIFLIIALFLLNLYPAFFDNSYYSASAQNFAYENGSYQIPDIEVVGNAPNEVKCDACGDSFSDDEAFNHHLRYSCACAIYYGWSPNGDDPNKEKNDEELGFDGQNFCPFCNRPYDYCDCSDIEVSGNRPTSDSWIVIVPNTPPDDEEPSHSINTDSTDSTDSTSPHFCSCLVTSTRKDAVKNLSASSITAKNKKTGFTANGVANSLKKTIEFPETIKQGQYGTCGAAMMEKQLAMYNPFRFRECIESLISTSQYPYWNLELPAECGIKNMTENEAKQKGLSLTDIIFQTAFATWAASNELLDKIMNKIQRTDGVFRPRTADGKDGGVSKNDIDKFMQEILHLSDTDIKTSRNCTISKFSNLDFDSNTFLVEVHPEYNKNTGKFEFPMLKSNHWAEVTGIDKDGVHVWTWGREIVVKEVFADNMVKRTKTLALKKDETERKGLSCKCNNCNDAGCSQCK